MNGETDEMNQTAYILEKNHIPFSPGAIQSFCLTEFARYQATLAGLSVLSQNEETPRQTGSVFLYADADLDAHELMHLLQKNQGAPALLCDREGNSLGYIASSVLSVEAVKSLPHLLLRHGRKITMDNYGVIFARRQNALRKKHQQKGVFFESPLVTISPLYHIEAGTVIGRGSTLLGSGSIGANCVIQGSRLNGAVLGDDVSVTDSVLLDCTVEDGTTVGPFAYLRPQTHVGKGVRIGDFVEIKNTAIGDGTKVSHLTYIGDSTVGKGVNFGCGTVVSNYDGIQKYPTYIGDHAFIGCNTNLIAPVTVGKNAYIAAGSTVTHSVPDGALAIARQRQTNKEHWVEHNKPQLIK